MDLVSEVFQSLAIAFVIGGVTSYATVKTINVHIAYLKQNVDEHEKEIKKIRWHLLTSGKEKL